MFKKTSLIYGLALFFMVVCVHAADASDHMLWGMLLNKHVQGGAVDYQGFKKDEAELDRYLVSLAKTDPDALESSDQLALYINAYNAYTVKLILKNFRDGNPVQSIKKIGGLFTSPWSISFAEIGGKTLTLDQIEHEIIRPRFQDPRIHFAVNCASKSCPPLISAPYLGETLDTQLDTSTRNFLADRKHNYLDADTLYVSSIFKWYGDDFNDDPAAYFLKYLEGESLEQLRRIGPEIRVKYLDYDWSLNGKQD